MHENTESNACSEREAVAAQAPEVTVTGSRSFDAALELVGSMLAAVRVALGGVLMLGDRDAGASGFAHVQWGPIPAINLYG